jgi:DNA-binding CsgD family transcriptional regulator
MHGGRGVILLGFAGEVESASPPTRRLLREFFPATSGGPLPAALVEWLESDGASRWFDVAGRGDWRSSELTARLLEERHEQAQLTARESQVLAWVARGKTNAEIARLLWLAPSNRRQAPRNVCAKLSVSTRTAAMARFLGPIDTEAF